MTVSLFRPHELHIARLLESSVIPDQLASSSQLIRIYTVFHQSLKRQIHVKCTYSLSLQSMNVNHLHDVTGLTQTAWKKQYDKL